MTTKKQREEKAENNYFKKKQPRPLKWENLLTKCKNCGSTELQKMNMFQGMKKKGNYQLNRCKNCGQEVWLEL
jgi:uncharacterized Zn finger protein